MQRVDGIDETRTKAKIERIPSKIATVRVQ